MYWWIGNWELLVPIGGWELPKESEVGAAPRLVFPKMPGAEPPIPPVVVPKAGVVPNPVLLKPVLAPNIPGLAVAVAVPPKIEEVWPNPSVDGVDVAVPKVGTTPAGFAPNGDCPAVKRPVLVLPRRIQSFSPKNPFNRSTPTVQLPKPVKAGVLVWAGVVPNAETGAAPNPVVGLTPKIFVAADWVVVVWGNPKLGVEVWAPKVGLEVLKRLWVYNERIKA